MEASILSARTSKTLRTPPPPAWRPLPPLPRTISYSKKRTGMAASTASIGRFMVLPMCTRIPLAPGADLVAPPPPPIVS